MANFDDIRHSPARSQYLQLENEELQQKLANIKAQANLTQRLKTSHLVAVEMIGYAVDLNYIPLYYIGAVKEISGYEEADLLSVSPGWDDLVHPEDLSKFSSARQYLLSNQGTQKLEYRIISGEGQIRWINDMAVPVVDESGQVIAIEGILLEVTRRKQVEEELLERQAHLNSILSSVQDVIWSVSPDTFELLYINPAAEKVYGYSLEMLYEDAANGYQLMHAGHELLLDNFTTLLQRGWFEAEYCINMPNGEIRWLNRRAHFAHDAHGLLARIDGTDRDITRRKQAEDCLLYISTHDCLTGLFNRFSFEKEMQGIDEAFTESVALIVCDVDGLKQVNDNMGHEAGDKLLIQCSQVLKTSVRQDEIVSRIGGDEFTILVKECSTQKVESIVKRLRIAMVEHNKSGPTYPLSLSIGYALKSSADMIMSEVFRIADNMMYAEKCEKHRIMNMGVNK